MTTPLTIWNLAALRCGEQIQIKSEDENTPAANGCRRFYPVARRSALQDWDWRFARRRQNLTRLTEVQFEDFDFVYEMPADCLFLRDVYNTDPRLERLARDRANPPFTALDDSHYPSRNSRFGQAIPLEWERHGYTDASGAHQTVICTHTEAKQALYVADVEDVSTFDPLFIDALGWRLAADLCMTLTRVSNRRAEFMNEYMTTADSAAARSAKEAGLANRQPDYILARR